MARTKSRPDIDATPCVGVTPYSTVGAADLSSMAISFFQLRSSYNVTELNASAANVPSRPGQASRSRHCERSEAIHGAAKQVWIARCARNDGKRKLYARLFARIRSANRLNR